MSFNPRTHEGCDFLSSTNLTSYTMFQSTHPRGVRRQQGIGQAIKNVSIHAPTRGATENRYASIKTHQFQSTHPRGVRPYFAISTLRFTCFNPRTHEGCDFILNLFKIMNTSFNPRTHEGCDFFGNEISLLRFVSIHAPTRGATAYSAKYRILIYKSSHFANINQTITFKVIKSLEFL